MEGQAARLIAAVVPEPLAVGDELHPLRPIEVEDPLLSGMDGQALPLGGVVRNTITVSDVLQPTGEVVEEDALLVAPDIVKGEVEDALPVATDIVNGVSLDAPEAGSGGVVLT
jgi:La-related protein 7